MSIPSEEILPNTTLGKIIELKRRRKEAVVPLGEEEHRKVRDAGRLTVRERLDYLLDEVSQVLFRLSRWENLEYAKKI